MFFKKSQRGSIIMVHAQVSLSLSATDARALRMLMRMRGGKSQPDHYSWLFPAPPLGWKKGNKGTIKLCNFKNIVCVQALINMSVHLQKLRVYEGRSE